MLIGLLFVISAHVKIEELCLDCFTVSFDLGLDFDENELNINQINTVQLPDNVIADIMAEIQDDAQKINISVASNKTVQNAKKRKIDLHSLPMTR